MEKEKKKKWQKAADNRDGSSNRQKDYEKVRQLKRESFVYVVGWREKREIKRINGGAGA